MKLNAAGCIEKVVEPEGRVVGSILPPGATWCAGGCGSAVYGVAKCSVCDPEAWVRIERTHVVR